MELNFTIFKRFFASVIMWFSICGITYAQVQITGKVLDDQEDPLPGVTVYLKGTNTGTITSVDGTYSLTSPKAFTAGDIIIFSFVGFKTMEVPVNNRKTIDVRLEQNNQVLNEIVVTALGIQREEKQLGYAQQTVDSEQLSQTLPNDWTSGLKGKVAGLNITSANSSPVSSQQITLRGNSSLNPNGNNALIVVDGVPINGDITSSGANSSYMGTPVDYGNGVSDLSLLDIESVSVLKGPGATALYGSRAANGALIITTKGGKKGKGLGVTINSGASFDVIQRWPDYQYEYGQGTGKYFDADGNPFYSYGASEDGRNTGSTSSAWGPKFEGQYYYQYDPELEGQSLERQLWRPYKNNRKDFWRTGVTLNNNITLSGGNENGSMRASVGHSKNEWIMPNVGFEKVTGAINANYKVSDKIKLESIINYTNRTSDNVPGAGYNNGSIAYFMIFQNPNINLDWFRPIWEKGKDQVQQLSFLSSYIDNPFLIAYEATNPLVSNQITGNLNATIDLTPNLSVMVRSTLNTYNQEREQHRPYSINRHKKGYYKRQDVFKQEVNSDFLVTYKNDINDSWFHRFSVGGNAMSYKYKETAAYVDGLVVPGVYKLSNGINSPILYTSDRNRNVNSVYGLYSLSYKDKIFLDITGRNDWSSTLPLKNNSFFYPSVSTSFIVSDILNLPQQVNYLKYRASFAQVGNDTDPYLTNKYYSQNAFPSSATVPTLLYNPNFKPEITTSYETGIESKLLNNRIGVNATWYQTSTKNQILRVPIDITTGYSDAVLNSGEVRNRGVELSLNGRIIRTSKFYWNSTITWSKNWNEVLALAEGIDGQQEIGRGGRATMLAKEGGSATAIYGYGFVRSPEGEIVYDKKGLPAYPKEIQYIGDATPDWKAGWQNSFTVGNFGFNFTIDAQYGGIIYSQSHHKLTQMGKLRSTFMGREEGFIIGDGVVDNGDGTYSKNTKEAITPAWYNRYYRRANVESNSFDASYIKLREVAFKYNIPGKLLDKTFIQNASLSVFGRNLAMISDFPIYDPETAALNGNTILPGIEMGQMPSPASYGINVILKL